MPVFMPPLPEQHSIVAHLNDAIGALARAADRSRSQVEGLKEYRARLIADVVTGKLDVREAAASLPEGDAPTAGEEGRTGQ